MARYKIVRFFARSGLPSRTIRKGLTLEEAQAHCKDPETSSKTCKKYHNRKRTKVYGAWFDGWTEE